MTTFLKVAGLVFGGAALLVITFAPLGWAISKLDTRWPVWAGVWLWMVTWIAVLCGVGVLYTQHHRGHSANDCADRGGIWSVSGHHRVSSGKSVMTVTDYACVMPR